MSKRTDKIEARKAEREDFLKGKRRKQIESKWEKTQIVAASAKSVLDYMVKQYEEHKHELTEDLRTKTEEQITLRTKEIEDLLMSAKEEYVKEIGEYNASILENNAIIE